MFEQVCPNYISYGMSYEQFWDGDCEIVRAYRKAHDIKLNEANQLAWLQGAYVYRAIGALAPALKALAKGRAKDYLKEPFRLSDDRTDKKPKEQPKENKAKTWLEMWAIGFNQKFEEKQAEENSEAIKDGGVDARRNDPRN